MVLLSSCHQYTTCESCCDYQPDLIALRQERLDEATAGLDEALGLARRLPYPHQEARLLHVYGQLDIREQRLEQTRGHLIEALAIFRRMGARKEIERINHEPAAIG